LEDAELMAQSEVLGCDGRAACDKHAEEQEDRTHDAHFATSIRFL
jgi:hypothetical protein